MKNLRDEVANRDLRILSPHEERQPIQDSIREIVHRKTLVPVRVLNPNPVHNPLVSVIVPTYNHEAFIAQCLEGILAQVTPFPFEILIGEDESSDRTREICEGYLEQYPDRICLILNDRRNNIRIDGRPSGRFNLIYLIASARGKYLAVCEGDDYWVDCRQLEKLTLVLESDPNCAIAFTNARAESVSGKALGSELSSRFCRNLSSRELALGARIPTRACVYRNVFRDFTIPEGFLTILNADTYTFSFLAKFGTGGRYVDRIEPPVYRIHEAGIWSGKSAIERRLTIVRTMRAIAELHSDSEYSGIISGRLLYEVLGFGLIEFVHCRFRMAIRYAREAGILVQYRSSSVFNLLRYIAVRLFRR